MKIISDKNFQLTEPTAVTLGNFDGLHLGHTRLINKALSLSPELAATVLSFYPHPSAVIEKPGDSSVCVKTMGCIFSSHERARLLEDMGVDIYIEYPFDKALAHMAPEDFFSSILIKQLNCKAIIVGEDYAFGRNRAGNLGLLKKLCCDYGIELWVENHFSLDGEKVSSSTIRSLIAEKKLDAAAKLLGRPFFISGIVSRGRQLGRTINFPTANLIPPEDKLLPPNGVYVTRTELHGKCYNSITNIGTNPTVSSSGSRTVESYIYNFDQEIYGSEITVSFYRWLRDEKRFGSLEELKAQMNIDKIHPRVLEIQETFGDRC